MVYRNQFHFRVGKRKLLRISHRHSQKAANFAFAANNSIPNKFVAKLRQIVYVQFSSQISQKGIQA